MSHLTKFEDLALEYEGFILEPGQMIIWADALSGVEEKLEDLLHREKYYEEPLTAEALEDLLSQVRQIRRTNQGAR